MQKINFAVMLFYYSLMAFVITVVLVLGEAWVHDHAVRLWSYSGEQYGFMVLLSSVNFISLNCQTIALQNERSGFITLLGYIGLVYAFLGDLLIFNEQLQWLELMSVGIILVLNIVVVCSKM